MYSKFFIYKVIICTIPLILMDIAFIYSMITGGYEGNLKATILAVIVFHILLYLLSHKQVKLLIQVFKISSIFTLTLLGLAYSNLVRDKISLTKLVIFSVSFNSFASRFITYFHFFSRISALNI